MIQNSKHIDHIVDRSRLKSAVAAEVCFEIEVVWDGNIFAELTQPLFIYISSKRTQKFFIQDQMNCSFQVVLTFKFQLGRHRGGSEVRTKDAQDK